MKRILYIIVLLLVMACCTDKSEKQFFKWEQTDEDFDRITEALEWNFISHDPLDSIKRNISRLEAIQNRNPQNRAMTARLYYWKARATALGDTSIKGSLAISRARTNTDSAKRPYEFTRIKHMGINMSTMSHVKRHRKLRECADFYERTEDPFMTAHIYIDIANLLIELSAPNQSISLFKKADSIYNMYNLDTYRLKNSANIANNLYELRDSVSADTILNSIQHNRLTEEDPVFHASILKLVYDRTDHHSELCKALRILDGLGRSDIRRALYMSCLADWYLRHSEPDSSLFWCEKCKKNMSRFDYDETRMIYYRTRSSLYKLAGRYDSAYNYLKEAQAYTDSVMRKGAALEVANREARANISQWEYETKRHQEQKQFYLYMVILTIVVLSLTSALIVARRLHRQRMSKAACEMELEKNRRELTYSQLLMTEKDNLLSTLIDDISKLRKEGNLSTEEAEALKQNIRVHQSGKHEWENFRVLFEQLHPAFSSQLRERHPDLTEGDIRLASYLRLGLTSKQIARMLVLQPVSVKKNRMRLRSRLGLEASQSLEDYLRRFPEDK